jgi:hypothetical protein
VAFGFHAGLVYPDPVCRRLSFLDRDDNTSEHYFIIDRSEETPETSVPNMDNGGFGGIERAILSRDCLTLHLCPAMATKMGEHNLIQITFAISDNVFSEIRNVLASIMRGYENRLEFLC